MKDSQKRSRTLQKLKVHNVLRILNPPPFEAKIIRSTPLQNIPLRCNLILSSHLRLGLQGGLFVSGFLTITLHASSLSITHVTNHPGNIAHGTKNVKILIMTLSPFSCYSFISDPNVPQLPIFKHSRPLSSAV